ncbi:MAG: protease SohB [Parahaliea sp.]
MDYFAQYGLFLAKIITFLLVFILVFLFFFVVNARNRSSFGNGHIEVLNLNERYKRMGDTIRDTAEDIEWVKAREKTERKAQKAKSKAAKKQAKQGLVQTEEASRKPRLFTIDFDGNMKASGVVNLREEISAIISQAGDKDAVLLRLESPGGMVSNYGLAGSQLARLRDAGIELTISVDNIAASGGYLMACIGNRIIAAPFALLGSIGVVAQVPNVHRLLKKNNVDYELFTAGKYKRTVTVLGENTEEGRAKFTEEINMVHTLFKDHISHFRPSLDIESVATGEAWYGRDALERGLFDEIKTSDDFIQEHLKDWDVYRVSYIEKTNWCSKLGIAVSVAIENSVLKILQYNQNPRV